MKLLHRTLAAALALACSSVSAANLFEATATTTDNQTPFTLTIGSSNFLNFSNDLLNSEGAFQNFDNRAYNAAVTYLGVANAITFSTNAAGTSLTVNFGPIGVSKTFTDLPGKDATDQFEDYFESEGSDVIARFLAAVAKQSPVALTDGNPTSATAGAANNLVLSQGFTSVDEMDGLDAEASGTAADGKGKFNGFALGFNSSKFEAGAFEGKYSQFSLGKTLFTRVAVSANIDYLDIEGAKVYGGGLNAAIPVRLRQMDKEQPLSWRITPMAGVSIRGSEDMANVAPLWQAGAVNTIDYRVSQKLVICVVNQLTLHKSFSLKYEDINIDPSIDQTIMKNGVRFVTPLSRRLILDGYIVDTRFLKDAAIKSFETIGGSLSLRASKSMNLTLGANYDTGSNYKAYSVGLSSAWKW